MAVCLIATARLTGWGRSLPAAEPLLRALIGLTAAAGFWSVPAAAADKVRLTNLSDVAFGTVANLTVDAVSAQNVCVYSNSSTNAYHVTAMGTGPGGGFALASGANSLAYQVSWSSSSGQSAGLLLSPNVPLTGQISSATQQTCNSGPATSASLIITLPAAALSSAIAGTYSGSLTLVVGPE